MEQLSDQKIISAGRSSSPVYFALFGIVASGAFTSVLGCIIQLGEWLMLWLKADLSVLKLYFPASELVRYLLILLLLIWALQRYQKPVKISSAATISCMIAWIFFSLGNYVLNIIGTRIWTSFYSISEFGEIQIWRSGSYMGFYLLYLITLAICLVYTMVKDREQNS